MSDIEFTKPFSLVLDVMGIDDRYPSVQFKFAVRAVQFTHSFDYCGDMWIENLIFDRFCHNLVSSDINDAHLYAFDDEFSLVIIKKPILHIRLAVRRINGEGELIEAKFDSRLDVDAFAAIRKSFLDFPKWW